MARMASCVVAGDGRLTGFLHMPVDPFVWVRVRRVSHLAVERSPGWEPETIDRLVSRTDLVLPERMDVSVVGVSDELVQLFDKYGVPFPAEVSELFSYEPAEAYGLVRGVRFVRDVPVGRISYAFMLLVDAWFAVNATVGSVVRPHLGEVALMRTLFSAFADLPGVLPATPSGWDWRRKRLVGYLLTPEVERKQLTVAQGRKREAEMVDAGYCHVW